MADPMNQEEIAEALGITRQSVQYILEKAYAKIRREFEQRGICSIDLLPEDIALLQETIHGFVHDQR